MGRDAQIDGWMGGWAGTESRRMDGWRMIITDL